MKPRLSFLLLLALSGDMACSTQVTPNGTGGRCESDDQCDRNQGLVCRCVRRKNTDEEGPDQIITPGFCEPVGFQCSDSGTPSDTGTGDTGTSDTSTSDTGAADSTPDVASETAADVGDAD